MTITREDLDAGRIDFGDVATGETLPPVHPGEILSEEFLVPLRISAYRLAKDLGVPATRIHAIVTGSRGITGDTALRLGRYFGTSAQMWINLQARYDLEMARQQVGDRVAAEVVPFGAARPTPGPCPTG
jgi:addiction module HigA family antidote